MADIGPFKIPHLEGEVALRHFDYSGPEGTFVASLWVGNENSHQEANAHLTYDQVVHLARACVKLLAEVDRKK